MPFRRRLEDRIWDLRQKALAAEGSELHTTLSELKAAVHEYIQRLRKRASLKLAGIAPERRHPGQDC
jgi:hypothetical protein